MKQENKTEINARSSFLGILPNLNFVTATKEKKSLVDIHESNFFSHFGIHQGVQVVSKPHSLRLVGLALLGLLTSHLVGTSLIHSAYAASYVNVSSGGGNSGTSAGETVSPGIVNLGSIKPTSTGTMATGNDTLTIHTDCSAGYKVYVSGQNGKSTNLINSNAEDPTSPEVTELISSASNLPTATASASSLNNNTWGINGNATDISSHLYYGLPSYSDATAYPLVTKSEVPEESTVPIYYGVKVNTDITPGTYTGDVLYTVIMDSTCLAYTVVFNSNGGTGTMESQSIMYNTEEELKQNTYTRSGYGFLGWSTNENGKTGNAVNGIGTLDDVEYSDLSEVNNLTTGGSTITLYAIWIKVDGNMQSWNGCSSLATNSIVRLIDTRDNKVYAVKKTPDGKCWMLQNLTISGTGLKVSALNNTNTNIPSTDSNSYYLPPRGKRYSEVQSITNPNVLTATDDVNFSTSATNNERDTFSQYPQVGYRARGGTDNDTGNAMPEETSYYNFYTATLGFSYFGDGKTSGSSTKDICPKGWHLPWTSDSGNSTNGNAEFYTLALSYNSNSTVWTNYIIPGTVSNNDPRTSDNTIRQNMVGITTGSLDSFANNGAVGFTYAGYFFGTSVNNVGIRSWYRSSSVAGSNAYNLSIDETEISPQNHNAYVRLAGEPARCVVDNYTISFDANGGTGSMENQIMFGTTSTALRNNTFTRVGYTFLGWSTNSSATSATYTNGQSVSGLTESGKTIKLYAVWKANYMQDFDCASMTPNTTITLIDSRDNQAYTVYRWPSSGTAGSSYPTNIPGMCIMTKDLSLGYVTGGSVTKGSNLTLTADNSQSAGTITARTGTGNWSTTDSDSNLQYINGSGGTYDSHSYYSYGAAQKVCPKGWRLPTNSEYGNIATFMGGNNSTGSAKIRGEPYNYILSGYFSDGWKNVGVYGHYWASTQYNSSSGNHLAFLTSTLTTSYNSKYFGMSVRCISEPSMQASSCSSLPTGTTATLRDTRDNQAYTVYRWPTSGTAGSSYPTSMSGYCLMTKDLNLGYVTGGSITRGTNLSLSTSTSAGSGTITSRTGSSDWSMTNSDSSLQYINGTGGTYASHSYYSYGAAQKVCPKGWAPPTNTQFSNIISFMGGNNSTGSSKIRSAPYNFVYGGCFLGQSGWYDVGISSRYWSSPKYGDNQGYRVAITSSELQLKYDTMVYGFSIRCGRS